MNRYLCAVIITISSTALAEPHAGDSEQAVRERWRTVPHECIAPSDLEFRGEAPKQHAGAAAISGGDDADPDPATVDARVFEDPVNWHKVDRISAESWLFRLGCGHGIPGIDSVNPSLLESFGSMQPNSGGQSAKRDPRVVFVAALRAHTGDADRRTLYEAALLHQCFAGTKWDVKDDYLRYLWCTDVLPEIPTREAVTKAAATVFGNRAWYRENFAYMIDRGLAARGEVIAAFTKQENAFPEMKRVLHDAAVDATAAFAKRHEKYAEIYKVVDPITQRFTDDPTAAPPADCSESLLGARTALGKALHATGEAGAHLVLGGDPLGHQITTALAYCYLRTQRPAHARMEIENLKGNRSTASDLEAAYFARLDAIDVLQIKLAGAKDQYPNHKGHDKVAKVVPPLRSYQALDDFTPVSLAAASIVVNEGYGAHVRLAGEEHSYPLIVVAMKPSDNKVMLTFKKTTTPWQDLSCHDTNKVDRIDYSGSSARVVYQQDCKAVGPIKQLPHQEPGFAIGAVDAKHVAVGSEIIAYVADDVGDGAVASVYPAGQPKRATVIGGVALSH